MYLIYYPNPKYRDLKPDWINMRKLNEEGRKEEVKQEPKEEQKVTRRTVYDNAKVRSHLIQRSFLTLTLELHWIT